MNPIEEYEKTRSLRRSRGRWRFVAIAVLVAGVMALSARFKPPQSDHVAQFVIDDIIFDDPKRDAAFRKIAKNDKAKALLLRINSPGGTVTGSEALYEAIRDVAEEKPVIATVSELAASGGYIAALAADRIVARQTSITGSVGVLFQMPNAHELLDRVGVEMFVLKSGDQKAEPTPYAPVSEDVIAVQKVLVEDNFNWFLGLVKERRALNENALALISDGRIVTGRMAVELGMIDAIGDREDAREWLEDEHEVSADLKLRDYTPRPKLGALETLLSSVGLSVPNEAQIAARLRGGMWAIYR